MVAYELKAGKQRSLVLKDFADRLQIPDITSFVTVMIQSAAFGTSIGEAMTVYANEMRDKRVMRVEEKANKLPTKMTLATMMFSVPPLLMILVGPSIMSLGILGDLVYSRGSTCATVGCVLLRCASWRLAVRPCVFRRMLSPPALTRQDKRLTGLSLANA